MISVLRSSRLPQVGFALALAACLPAQSRIGVVRTEVRVDANVQATTEQPVWLAPAGDGRACLGYTSPRGHAHVVSLDANLRRVGAERKVQGYTLVALHAHADGSVGLLVSSEEGPNEHRPAWCAQGANTLWLIELDAKGEEVFCTRLVGGRGYGPQATWFIPQSAGVLRYDGSSYGAFYSIGRNFAKQGQPPNPHEGDEFKAVDRNGTIDIAKSCSWNCSHSIDQRMVVTDGQFRTLAMGDMYPVGIYFKSHPSRQRRAVWPTRELVKQLQALGKKTFFPGELGGIAPSGDGFAGVATTFVRDTLPASKNRAHRYVMFLRFATDGAMLTRTYLTRRPATRRLRSAIAAFGPHSLVAWGDPEGPHCQMAVLARDGSYVERPRRVKHPLNRRAGFSVLANGDVAWAGSRAGSRKLQVYRIRVPKAWRTAAAKVGQSPASRPIPVQPKPKGKLRVVSTTFVDGSIKTEASVDAEGTRFGEFKRYYRSGGLRVRETYAAGKRWGKSTQFYRNGRVKVSTAYVDGREHGVRSEFDSVGKLELRTRYHLGDVQYDSGR